MCLPPHVCHLGYNQKVNNQFSTLPLTPLTRRSLGTTAGSIEPPASPLVAEIQEAKYLSQSTTICLVSPIRTYELP